MQLYNIFIWSNKVDYYMIITIIITIIIIIIIVVIITCFFFSFLLQSKPSVLELIRICFND